MTREELAEAIEEHTEKKGVAEDKGDTSFEVVKNAIKSKTKEESAVGLTEEENRYE